MQKERWGSRVKYKERAELMRMRKWDKESERKEKDKERERGGEEKKAKYGEMRRS